MKVVLLNNIVIVPSVLFLNVFLNDYKVIHSFEMEDLPSMWTFYWQYYFCTMIDDFVFFTTHRLLHTPFWYKHVHKLHHQYNQSVSICAEYAHPIEFIFSNMLPLGVPCMMLGRNLHFYTFLTIGTLKIIGTSVGHSGYEFHNDALELYPFRASSRYHDYHHEGNINGNFGGGTIIYDWIFGYNKQYFQHIDKLEKQLSKLD